MSEGAAAHPRVARGSGRGHGRALLRAVPWTPLAAGWVAAFALGALCAAALRALDWWPGAAWERDVLARAHETVGPALDVVMLTLPYAGTNYTLAPIVAIAAVLLWRRGRPAIALHLLIVQVGSWALNPALKFSFPRDRPTLFEQRGQFALPAFPSGHAIAVVAVLFTVAWLLRRYGRGTWAFWVVGAFLIVNSYSRLYLGVHWPTDVIAGALVGAVWLAVTLRLLRPLHAASSTAPIARPAVTRDSRGL